MCPLAIPDCFPTPTTRNLSSVSNLRVAEFSMLSSEISLFSLSFQRYFSHLGSTTANSYEFSFSEVKISTASHLYSFYSFLYPSPLLNCAHYVPTIYKYSLNKGKKYYSFSCFNDILSALLQGELR